MKFIIRLLLQVLKYLSYAVLVIALLLVIWGATVRVYRFMICAEYPNGLIIGWAALFDPAEFLWTPNLALKLPNGEILISSEIFPIWFSQTTVMGVGDTGPTREDLFDFAYRKDTGLVIRKENPEKYSKIKAEAGELVWLLGGRTDTNLLGAYLEMIKDPAYRRTFCPLPLFPQR